MCWAYRCKLGSHSGQQPESEHLPDEWQIINMEYQIFLHLHYICSSSSGSSLSGQDFSWLVLFVCVSNLQLKYSNKEWTLTKNQRNSAYKRWAFFFQDTHEWHCIIVQQPKGSDLNSKILLIDHVNPQWRKIYELLTWGSLEVLLSCWVTWKLQKKILRLLWCGRRMFNEK